MRRVNSEKEGIPSIWLINMMNRWEEQLCHVHGYMILRNGNIVAEAYQYPYTDKSRRMPHSVSKTVTAIAVGYAVDEGRISVQDKVLSFFPEYRPGEITDGKLQKLTVANLLTMSVGHGKDSIDSIFSKAEPGWKTFLDMDMVNEPGETYLYDSGATYMLSKILTIVTGEKILDYLMPRFFQPLGITDADWDEIDGASTGGWGCLLSIPDMAKIGQFLLQKGKWEGKQLLSEQWIEEMTSWKIPSHETNVYQDWRQGYCYQMWRCSREGCFRADGAFGQYILVLPPKNMVAVIWSEDAYSQDMLDSFWEEVYDKADNRIYGVDGNAYEVYHKKCREWSAPLRIAPTYSYKEKLITDQIYETAEVEGRSVSDSMCFSFSDCGQLKLILEKNGSTSEICANNTEMYFGDDRVNFEIASFIRLGKKGMERIKYGAVYQWLSDHVLKVTVNWLETAHTTEITCVFGEDCVSAVFSVSYRKYLLELENMTAILNADQWFTGKIQEREQVE